MLQSLMSLCCVGVWRVEGIIVLGMKMKMKSEGGL